jgi:outer membrane protein OmpA-like peptidoglycan-associated protein
MPSRFAAAALLLVLLAGCAAIPTPFSNQSPSTAAAAAPTGSGAPGTVDPRIPALVSAGTKPLAGAAVAAYMTSQEQELHTQLDGKGVSITRSGNQIVIDVPVDVAFDLGKTKLKPGIDGTLASIGLILKHFNQTIIDVYGYTDTQSPASAGKDLSQKRAVAVATILTNQGVDQSRFYIEGRGPADPIAPNTTDADRAQNRRIDIQISPVI